ncbi:MAG: hypothetical protein JWO22_2000 [Frankiales bacterium]|nr:hypothetical protein [Frankiales bacterium]
MSRKLLLVLALTAACGTTVPQAAQVTGSSDGLGASTPSTGTQLPTGTDGVTTTGVGPATVGSGGGATGGSPGAAGLSTAAPGTGPTSVALPAEPVTAPLQIGLMAAGDGVAANSAIGRSAPTDFTSSDAVAAFVRALNAKGGVAGRKVTVVTSYINVSSSNYDTEATAACANFTQDHHVAVVLSFDGSFYSEPFSSCIAKAQVPEITLLDGGTDAATLNHYPLLFSPQAPTLERRFTALVSGLTGGGVMTAKHKVGIVVEGCPADQRVASSVLEPQLKRRGIASVSREVNCVHGFGDAAGFIAAVQSTVLPLRSAGVDQIVFVSGFEQVGAQYFEQQASTQGWKPTYLLTSAGGAGYNDSQLSADAQARVHGVGWRPTKDVTTVPVGNAQTQRCRTLWKAYPPAANRANANSVFPVCEAFFFLEAGLKRTAGHAEPTVLGAGLRGLGSTFISPSEIDGETLFSSTRKDGPRLFSAFGYVDSCTCVRYSGRPFAG